MKELTEQLLLLARNEEQWKVEMTSIDAGKLAQEVIRSFRAAFQREINMRLEENVIVHADEQKLKQLFYILIENAYKYSEDSITVRVRKAENQGIIEIIDQGVGIPAEELPKVFDRFYRVDKARTRKTGGFGLGLSLARKLLRRWGRTLVLKVHLVKEQQQKYLLISSILIKYSSLFSMLEGEFIME
ncbi:sensor histidine kinase [Bacillus sp. N9]